MNMEVTIIQKDLSQEEKHSCGVSRVITVACIGMFRWWHVLVACIGGAVFPLAAFDKQFALG